MDKHMITIERYLLSHQPEYAKGELTTLFYDIAMAAKMIAGQIRRGALLDILGYAYTTNIQGEQQRKLDVYADSIIYKLNNHTGRLCAMVSEEREDVIPIPEQFPKGKYVLVFDPLDGSSNIDIDVSVGTIFGIYNTLNFEQRGQIEDCLRPARDLVAAGYILYGPSTMFVYSAGHGVHGFTLDPELGEFILTHELIRFPNTMAYYSVNHRSHSNWQPRVQQYVSWLQFLEQPKLLLRYIGSLVADFHRNLFYGGVFCYPADKNSPNGKIRLLYEAGPLAFLAEQAGGYASNGAHPILDITPGSLHQRTPLYIGNKFLVEKAESMIGE